MATTPAPATSATKVDDDLRYQPRGDPERDKPILAESANFSRLRSELLAYASEALRGRSCLIAGSRGAGKTTLIMRAADEANAELTNRRLINAELANRKLIIVRLHGPSLLKPPRPASTKDEPNPQQISINEHVLKTVVVNLYQTAAEEVSREFAEFVSGCRAGPELSAQLRLALDGAPSAATLRRFWEQAGALGSGVLFKIDKLRNTEYAGERASAEILALATAAEAYRRCTGNLKQEVTDGVSSGDKREAKTELSASGKEFSKAIVGLTSGVAAGATAAALGQGGIIAALAGALTALASVVTISYSRTQTREVIVKDQMTFLPDMGASSLIHRVLLLLRRVNQAGLYPVFVVDELDKVGHAESPLNDLTSSLKFLFADQAFFCFLTDRSYFAQIARKNREHPNTPLRTIFGTQLLVQYDTDSIRTFLERVLPVGPDSPLGRRVDAEAFRRVLMCRSRMLLFELSRDLAGYSTANDGRIGITETLEHQIHLTIQLAIELVLTSDFVSKRLSHPLFSQTIYDALYYPVLLWYADEQEIDCAPDALIEGIAEKNGEAPDLDEADRDFLHAQVVAMLLDLLTDLPRLTRELRSAIPQRVSVEHPVLLDRIPKEISLLEKVANSSTYRWQYRPSGIPFRAAEIGRIIRDTGLWAAASFLENLAQEMNELIPRRDNLQQVRADYISAVEVFSVLENLQIRLPRESS